MIEMLGHTADVGFEPGTSRLEAFFDEEISGACEDVVGAARWAGSGVARPGPGSWSRLEAAR
jgi:hypothetical protein